MVLKFRLGNGVISQLQDRDQVWDNMIVTVQAVITWLQKYVGPGGMVPLSGWRYDVSNELIFG
jgi:hypothetical protein